MIMVKQNEGSSMKLSMMISSKKKNIFLNSFLYSVKILTFQNIFHQKLKAGSKLLLLNKVFTDRF